MKVLLIPPAHAYNYTVPFRSFLSASDFPAGFAYIAGALKAAGHEVTGLTINPLVGTSAYQMVRDCIKEHLGKHTYDLIGVGGLCTDYAFIYDAMRAIRQVTKTPIVLGGGVLTHDREYIFNLLHPDFGIVGEGEGTVASLTRVLGGQSEVIPNLSWWDGKVPIHNSVSREYPDIDSLPLPDYDVFGIRDMLDNYSDATRLLYRYSRQYPRPWTILASRGCCFSCNFCVHRQGQEKYRARSIPNIMAEIKESYEKYGFNILIILDELFAVDKQRVRDFCAGVMEGKQKYGWDFDFMFQTHASADLGLEDLKMLKEAGCFFFSYGIESASPTVLKSMDKKIQLSQIENAIKLAKEVKLGFSGNLIFGDPNETEETIRESLRWWIKWGQSTEIFLSFVIPYPGSRIFDEMVSLGRIKNRRLYYEALLGTVAGRLYNMTRMSDEVFTKWIQNIAKLEGSWRFVKPAPATRIWIDTETKETPYLKFHNSTMHFIEAVCPYCGETARYRQSFTKVKKNTFLGVGCTNCHQRIRIDLYDERSEGDAGGGEAVLALPGAVQGAAACPVR